MQIHVAGLCLTDMPSRKGTSCGGTFFFLGQRGSRGTDMARDGREVPYGFPGVRERPSNVSWRHSDSYGGLSAET